MTEMSEYLIPTASIDSASLKAKDGITMLRLVLSCPVKEAPGLVADLGSIVDQAIEVTIRCRQLPLIEDLTAEQIPMGENGSEPDHAPA